MVDRCRLCGDKIEHEKEKEKGLCHSCLHHGFVKLKEIIGRISKQDG